MSGYTSIIDGYLQRQQQTQQPVYQQPSYVQAKPVQQAPRPSVGKKQKIVEIIIERPVIVHKYVDIEEETIIEVPVERRIEQEIYVERTIEVPVERIIETEVEVIREEIVEIVIEREVEYERFVDIPVEKYVEIPIEVIREVEVKVPVYVDKVLDRTILKPIETRIQENQVINERQVVQDRYVDRHVEIPIDRIVEIVQERRVEREFYTEIEKIIRNDRYVDVPVERPYDVVVERPYTREVEIAVKVDKIVERPYDVIIEKIREVPRDVVRERQVTVAVDKVIEVPVEKIIEIGVRNEIHTELVFEHHQERPVFDNAQVDIPQPRYVDKPVQIDNIVENPIERVQERIIEVPFGKIIERPVPRELAVETFRINEQATYVDRTVDVPVGVERYVEVPREEIIEKVITLQKIIERPVVIPRYVDRYVDKVVDVKVEIVVPKIVEVPRQNYIDKIVEVTTRIQRVNYRETAQNVPINTILKKNTISQAQKRRFQESSIQLANTVVENEKMKAELGSLSEIAHHRQLVGSSGVNVNERDQLQRTIQQLESSLRQKETERNRLRQTSSTAADLDIREQQDSSDIPKLQAHIQRVKAENENLRRIAAKGGWHSEKRQVGSRISHQTTVREGPTVGNASVRRSVSTTQTQRVTGGNINIIGGQPNVRQSGSYATAGGYNQTGVTRTSNTYAQQGATTSYGQPATASYGQPATTSYGQQGATTSYGQQGATTSYGQPATTSYGQPATTSYTQGGVTRTSGGYTQPGSTNYTQGGATGGYAQPGSTTYSQGGVVRRSQTSTIQATSASPVRNQVQYA